MAPCDPRHAATSATISMEPTGSRTASASPIRTDSATEPGGPDDPTAAQLAALVRDGVCAPLHGVLDRLDRLPAIAPNDERRSHLSAARECVIAALSAADRLANPQRPAPAGAGPGGASSRFHILVVDDSRSNRMVAVVMLNTSGYRVSVAADGTEALAAIRARRPDLVLMDIAMPGMDGLQATAAIRALGGDIGRTPVIAVTANVLAEDRARCRAAGLNDFLAKPYQKAELLHMVARWLPDDGRSDAPALPEAVAFQAAFPSS